MKIKIGLLALLLTYEPVFAFEAEPIKITHAELRDYPFLSVYTQHFSDPSDTNNQLVSFTVVVKSKDQHAPEDISASINIRDGKSIIANEIPLQARTNYIADNPNSPLGKLPEEYRKNSRCFHFEIAKKYLPTATCFINIPPPKSAQNPLILDDIQQYYFQLNEFE